MESNGKSKHFFDTEEGHNKGYQMTTRMGIANAAYEDDNCPRKVNPTSDGVSVPFPSKTSTDTARQHSLRREKVWLVKNLACISIGFALLFVGYVSLVRPESPLHSDLKLSAINVGVIFGAAVLSALLFPTLLVRRLGCKWSIVACSVTFAAHFATHFYPEYYTLLPTAVLLGLALTPLWTAQGTYLSEAATRYAEIVNEKPEDIIVIFFGWFFFVFQTCHVWGNLVIALLLSGHPNATTPSMFSPCGSYYCYGNGWYEPKMEFTNETTLSPSIFDAFNESTQFLELTELPPTTTEEVLQLNLSVSRAAIFPWSGKTIDEDRLYLVGGVYLAFALAGTIFLALFVDQWERRPGSEEASPPMQLLATIRLLIDPRLLLLIPISVFLGLEHSYIINDFKMAYVVCSLGIHHVAFILITYGGVSSLSSLLFGSISKHVGRLPLLVFAALLNVTVILVMLFWDADGEKVAVYFIIAGLWGMADAIWNTQINATYGYLFSDRQEAGFSNLRLWTLAGFIIGFAWAEFLCIPLKIYVVAGFLGVGFLGCLATEVLIWKTTRRSHDFKT